MFQLIYSNRGNKKIKTFDCIIEKKSDDYLIALLNDPDQYEFIELIDQLSQPYSLEVVNHRGSIADAFFDPFEEKITISQRAYERLIG